MTNLTCQKVVRRGNSGPVTRILVKNRHYNYKYDTLDPNNDIFKPKVHQKTSKMG